MSITFISSAFSRTFCISSMTGVALAFAAAPTHAADQVQPPPYQIAAANGVTLNVIWDEAAIRKALPPGIKPVKDMTGGINIYSAGQGYAIGPYSAAYFYVDIEGFDSAEGIKGRWMLAGAYGPQEKTSEALKQYEGLPVRPGSSRQEPAADGKYAIGTVNGQDFVNAEIKPVSGSCETSAVLLNYVSISPETRQVAVIKIPVVADGCKAELISAKVTAPPGDPFSAFPVAKFVGASEFRNASFTITALQSAAQ